MRKKPNRRKMIKEMVDRIVERFDPEKIILFGSHALKSMSASMLGHRLSGAGASFILMSVLGVLLSGCVVYEPLPTPAYYGSSYDRVWDSALGAAEDAGVKITSVDRTTGIIRGVTGSTDVTVSVTTQADGRIRVAFSSKGAKGEDADLNDRFTRFYNRRMGRM